MSAAGLLASAFFIYLAVRRIDFGDVANQLDQADLLPWVPLGILSYLLGHLVRGLRCRLLVRREAVLGRMTASNIVVVGYASNNVLPARMGELVRAGMLAERSGIPLVQSLAVTFIERVLDGLAIVGLLAVALMTGSAADWIQDLVRVALLVFGVATIALLAAAFSPTLLVSASSRLGNRLGRRMHDRLVSLATSVTNAGACLRDPRDAMMLGLYSLVIWALEAGLFIAILPVFGLPTSIQLGVVAMCVTNLGLLVPSSPGFIGPFHYFCSQVLIVSGVASTTALVYATLVHLAFYVPVTLWGAIAMLWYGIEVGSTAALAREAKRSGATATVRGIPVVELATLASSPREPEASAFTTALVECLVAAPDHAREAAAVAYAARFVEGQLAALSPRLRALYSIGMLGFRVVTRLRFLRGYCDVALAKRSAWTSRWAGGRIGLLRQLFKPVRATALLAYYDHEEVSQALLGRVIVPAASLVRPAAVAEASS